MITVCVGFPVVSLLPTRLCNVVDPSSPVYSCRVLADFSDRIYETVKIGVVGKYTQMEDAYLSVIKALQHAAMAGAFETMSHLIPWSFHTLFWMTQSTFSL